MYNEDLKAISNWLKENGIQTVAMESTGTYWQALYAVLLNDGFQVILCNGKFVTTIKSNITRIRKSTKESIKTLLKILIKT